MKMCTFQGLNKVDMGNSKWNYDTCFEEAKKYKTRSEFCKGNSGAYKVAHKNGWMNDYTWLKKRNLL